MMLNIDKCPNCGATNFLGKSIDITNDDTYHYLYGIWPLRKHEDKIFLDYCTWCLFPEAYDPIDVIDLLKS